MATGSVFGLRYHDGLVYRDIAEDLPSATGPENDDPVHKNRGPYTELEVGAVHGQVAGTAQHFLYLSERPRLALGNRFHVHPRPNTVGVATGAIDGHAAPQTKGDPVVLSSTIQPHEHGPSDLRRGVVVAAHWPTAIGTDQINVSITVQISVGQSLAVFVEVNAEVLRPELL